MWCATSRAIGQGAWTAAAVTKSQYAPEGGTGFCENLTLLRPLR